MLAKRKSAIGRTVVVALAVAAGWLLRPATAEAQARGSLQATAQVVDIQASSFDLLAAHAALQQVAAGAPSSRPSTVPTLAQISVARSPESSALVVTVDYSRD